MYLLALAFELLGWNCIKIVADAAGIRADAGSVGHGPYYNNQVSRGFSKVDIAAEAALSRKRRGVIMQWYRPFLYVWASPATMLGLILVPIVLLQGGSAQVVAGVLEVHGGIVTTLLRRGLPWVGAGAAMTLGHVVWGCDERCLDRTRAHERVHVRQYERWGPFFIPVYLLASLVAWCRGLNPYLDNPFEREAYGQTKDNAD